MPDALKDGRFVVVGTLGEGAQGQTFDGVDKREGRAVAIKRFDVRTAKTWKDAELAERETRVLQTLTHPMLPRYHDHFEEDGALYLVMDKIEGESLAALQRRGAVFTEDDAVRLLRDASEVLDYLHGRSPAVIHRDLKPGNVIRRPNGSFAFVDFGAVRDKLRTEGGSTVVGTFGYMAPEQFQGRATPASDVYAIGATALAMLTGRQPEGLPHKGLAIDVRSALGARASPRLVEALAAMVDPDPDRRPDRIALVLERLEPPRRRRVAADGAPARRTDREAGDDLGRRFAEYVRHAEEYEARAREYERRAEAGGAGASGWLHGAEGWRKGAMKWRAAAERHAGHLVREAERVDRRSARRAARRAGRASRRTVIGEGRLPWPLALVLALFFTVGILAVAVATQIVVPLALEVLSLFFASRALRSAAHAVRETGAAAFDRMNRSRRWFLGGAAGDRSEGRVRIEGDALDGNVRIASDAPGGAEDEAADEGADPRKIDEAARR